MASEVDVCNLALGNLGDNATVASLDPPEGSAQAEHCARFYPIARDSLLELHTWGFSTTRTTLSLLTSGWPEWTYCYAQPADALNLIAVLPPESDDDYSGQYGVTTANVPLTGGGQYVPQPYSAESLDDGTLVIYTDQENAVLRYTQRVTDTTKFSPLFITTLSWHLASMLAGPLIKGDEGRAESKRCAQMMQAYLAKAAVSDANQRKIRPVQNVGWMTGR